MGAGGKNSTMTASLLLLWFSCTALLGMPALAQTNFQDLYKTDWSADHVHSLANGQQVQLVLDLDSGAGFQSKQLYTYGFFSVSMKLIPGNSAGTCTAFFLSSAGAYHDEVDYEFLGNSSGEPYILQTNMFANGVGGREQRLYLWFDPTADFHTYGFVWNHAQIIFLVDNEPIRVFKNLRAQGLEYPDLQGSGAYGALFDASDWATQHGNVKLDWSAAPFIASYGAFQIDGCPNNGADTPACATNYQNNYWEGPAYTTLSQAQIDRIQFLRQNYFVYDYCTDAARNPTPPLECAYNYNT